MITTRLPACAAAIAKFAETSDFPSEGSALLTTSDFTGCATAANWMLVRSTRKASATGDWLSWSVTSDGLMSVGAGVEANRRVAPCVTLTAPSTPLSGFDLRRCLRLCFALSGSTSGTALSVASPSRC